MKRIIYSCILALSFIVASVDAMAQPATKTAFVTLMGQYNSNVSAGKTIDAETNLRGLMEMMMQRLRDGQDEYGNAATPAQKTVISGRLNEEKGIYTEVWRMAKKADNNRPAIKTKLYDFSKTF